MASRNASSVLSGPEQRKVANLADLILAYPEGRFRRKELHEDLRGQLPDLKHSNIALVVEREEDDKNHVRNVYRIVEQAREHAREQVTHRDAMCPCGHAGLRNCGSHYECTFEKCSREFARDELEVDE